MGTRPEEERFLDFQQGTVKAFFDIFSFFRVIPQNPPGRQQQNRPETGFPLSLNRMPGGDCPGRPGLRINGDNHPDRRRIGNRRNIGGAGAGQPVGVRMVMADNRPALLPRTAVCPQKV